MKLKTLGISSLVLAASALAFTGCSSPESRYKASIEAAGETDAGYNSLNSALSASVTRLQGLSARPGSPSAYLADVNSVEKPLRDAADTLASARADLRSSTEKQLAVMQDQATKLQSAELARDFASKTEKLRGYFSDYDAASASIADDLTKGFVAISDVKIAVGANPTDEVVALTKASVDRAADAFKSAQGKIGDARKALDTLRANQPRPVAN